MIQQDFEGQKTDGHEALYIEHSPRTTWVQTLMMFVPVFIILAFITSVTFIKPFQDLFLSYFEECSNLDFEIAVILVFVGFISTVVMLPFVLYELAIGYSCQQSYVWPVVLCVLSKLFGETLCFWLGRILEPKLRPILQRYKLFKAIDNLTKQNPMKASFLLRLSMVTPQLILNYGSGVIGSIPFFEFMMAANITGLPHSIFMTLVGKEMSNIHDIFNSESIKDNENQTYRYIEVGLSGLALIVIFVIIYHIQKHYKKVLDDSISVSTRDDSGAVDQFEVEMTL